MKMDLNPYIIKKLDKLWTQRIFLRANGRCELCEGECPGDWVILDAHHLISRGHLATRWELQNGIYICRYWHNHPKTVLEELRKRGDKRYEFYMENRYQVISNRDIDIDKVAGVLAA